MIAAAAELGPLALGSRCRSAGGVVSGQGPGETSLRAAGRPKQTKQTIPKCRRPPELAQHKTAMHMISEALQQTGKKVSSVSFSRANCFPGCMRLNRDIIYKKERWMYGKCPTRAQRAHRQACRTVGHIWLNSGVSQGGPALMSQSPAQTSPCLLFFFFFLVGPSLGHPPPWSATLGSDPPPGRAALGSDPPLGFLPGRLSCSVWAPATWVALEIAEAFP